MNDRKERCKKRAVNSRVKKAVDERISNTKTTEAETDCVELTIPFRIATKLNQEASLRKSQNNIRKQLSAYAEAYFERFVDDCNKITDPALRARLYVEVIKLIIPRAKEFEHSGDDKEIIITHLFHPDKQDA